MIPRFQFDEQIPHAVALALRRRGIDIITATEAECLGVPDAAVLERARAAGRVIVTFDYDYVQYTSPDKATPESPPSRTLLKTSARWSSRW